MARAVIHFDLDAFYASVEELRHPELRGKALIVGGHHDADGRLVVRRGVVATASYAARRFGVHSAMPLATALRLCPEAIVLPADFDAYREASRQVFQLVAAVSPAIEPLSLDEAFVDVTHSTRLLGPAEQVARALRDSILEETGLTASFGVATSKSVAKIASDLDKPHGFVVVPEGTEAAFLAPLALRRLPGLGPAAETSLLGLGVTTLGQLAALPEDVVVRRLGQAAGSSLWHRAQGVDTAAVAPPGQPRSISRETTFDRDIEDPAELERQLLSLAEDVGRQLREQQLVAHTISLRLRLATWETLSRQRALDAATDSGTVIRDCARGLLRSCWTGQPVRLLGVGSSGMATSQQLDLFAAGDGRQRITQLEQSLDQLRHRFGADAVRRGVGTRRPDLDFHGEDLRRREDTPPQSGVSSSSKSVR